MDTYSIRSSESEIIEMDHFSEFCFLLCRNQTQEIARFVAEGGDLRTLKSNGDSLLHVAAKHSNSDVISFLIENGVPVEDGDKDDESCLTSACSWGRLDNVKLLVEKWGANVNQVGKYSGPLHAAVSGGHRAIVKYLLDNKADVNKASQVTLRTPKHVAFWTGHHDIADLLMSSQADVESEPAEDCNRCTPIDLLPNTSNFYAQVADSGCNVISSVAQNADEDLISFRDDEDVDQNVAKLRISDKYNAICETSASLVKNCNEDVFSPITSPQLNIVQAIKSGNMKHVISFVTNNPDWMQAGNKLLKDGQTLLHVAAKHPHPEIVKLLINNGCSVEATDEAKLTPLTYACKAGHLENVEVFIKCNARVNAVGKNSGPLHAATDKRIIEFLLKHPAINVNTETLALDNKLTPLHCACDKGDEEKVQLLLAAGASVDVYTDKHIVPSKLPRCPESIKLLIQCHQNTLSKLIGAMERDDTELVKNLAESREIQSHLKGLGSLLHLAAKHPKASYKMMKMLVEELDIPVDGRDLLGQTPLMVACHTTSFNKVATLCELNADVKVRTEIDATLLHIAARHSSSSVVEYIVKTLELDVNHADKFGRTPLTWACSADSDQNCEMLLRLGADVNRMGHYIGPLHAAVRSGKETRVRTLLSQATIRVNAQTMVSKETALRFACRSGNKTLALLLKENGAEWDIVDCYFRAPGDDAPDDIRALWRSQQVQDESDAAQSTDVEEVDSLAKKCPDVWMECVAAVIDEQRPVFMQLIRNEWTNLTFDLLVQRGILSANTDLGSDQRRYADCVVNNLQHSYPGVFRKFRDLHGHRRGENIRTDLCWKIYEAAVKKMKEKSQ